MMPAKNSIARRIGLYFLTMIAFASLISGISLAIMWSKQSDAALVNVSGSLRFQSYRFIYDLEQHPESLQPRLAEYQQTLDSSLFLALTQSRFTPEEVLTHYQQLRTRWQTMADYLRTGNIEAYRAQIEGYFEQVNQFVYALQAFAEVKIKVAIAVIALSMLWIIALAYFGVWYTKNRIIIHLDQLVIASQQIKNEDFHHLKLPVNEPNELGLLASAFTQMAAELAKLYASLEEKVEDKTRRLIAVNRSMLVLYQCSQILSSNPLNKASLQRVLQTLLDNEQLKGISLSVYGAEHWDICLDQDLLQEWRYLDIAIENEKLAKLGWKPSLLCPDERLIQSVSEMIGRSIYVIQMQKQQQQLLLMEERSIIARELHDSLAQSLTFFKIQISLLKRNASLDEPKRQQILHDLEQALNGAYSQLRELLATFRLTIQEANLTRALESLLGSLKQQTAAEIQLSCKLPSQLFNAQQQVHLLQIVREAVINAIKHSEASLIEVIADTSQEGEQYFLVRDNGKGIASITEPDGHYGLTIMKERSAELNADFTIRNRPSGGTEVRVTLPNLLGLK